MLPNTIKWASTKVPVARVCEEMEKRILNFIWNVENILEWDRVEVAVHWENTKSHWTVQLKMVNLMLCE